MTQDSRPASSDQLQRSIVARPIDGNSVLTVIGSEPGQRGPWPFLTGVPGPDIDLVAPPPQYLSVAGWAA